MVNCFDEQWRTVVGFPNYEVSNLGRVRRRQTGYILKLKMDRKGNYLLACLSAYPKVHERPVHQLVMHAFVGPQAKGIETRHLDGDYLNNRLDNLAYGTKSDNMQDAIRHGTFPLLEDRPNAKLTREQAVAIYKSDESAATLASRYGVKPGVIRQIKTRETWRSVTEGLPPPVWNFRHKPAAETVAIVFDRTLSREEVMQRTGLSLHQVKYLRKRYAQPPVPFADRLNPDQWAIILDPNISTRVAAERANVSRSYVETQRRAAGILTVTENYLARREKVVAIYTSEDPTALLAERFGVSATTIKQIKTGKAWRSATEGLPLPMWRFRAKPSAETLTIVCNRSLSRAEVMRRTGLSLYQVEYLRERHSKPPVSFADRLSKEQWDIILDLSIGATAAARRAGVSLGYVKTQRRLARNKADH